MFKPVFVLILIAFQSTNLLAQAYKDSIGLQFSRYTQSLMQKDFSKSAEYINPDFFKVITKEQLIGALETVFNNPDLDFKIEDPKIISIGNNRNFSKQNFVKLQYSNYLSMHIKNDNNQSAAQTTQSLNDQFGADNVKYDPVTNTYKIFLIKNVIANSADNKTWTFVVVEERQKPLLAKFIPKELL
jgi:hypothetical protein